MRRYAYCRAERPVVVDECRSPTVTATGLDLPDDKQMVADPLTQCDPCG
ncbi:hypothetical protein OHA33_02535 [Streptomyces sp. NBC_00562]|nr:hypothetical protein OHA33_02535 [Streptomyces sp. NBC_00562]